jgi:hypothetical protein
MKIIRVVGFAWGPCPFAGQYLMSFDFESGNGLGFGEFTSDRSKAMRFAGLREAMEFWRTPSKTRPLRPDGKPNRPFTATTIEIISD